MHKVIFNSASIRQGQITVIGTVDGVTNTAVVAQTDYNQLTDDDSKEQFLAAALVHQAGIKGAGNTLELSKDEITVSMDEVRAAGEKKFAVFNPKKADDTEPSEHEE